MELHLFQILNVNVVGQTILQVRSKKDVEITGGLRLRAVPAQGVVAAFDNATLTQVPTSYTASTTFTATATSAQVEGTGLTVDVNHRWIWNYFKSQLTLVELHMKLVKLLLLQGTELGGATPVKMLLLKLIQLLVQVHHLLVTMFS